MTTTVRRATAADHDVVVATRLEFLADVREPGFGFPADFAANTRSFIEIESAQGRLHTWIAQDGPAVVGVVSMLLWPRPPQPEDQRTVEGYIINMYVSPDHQRQGVGKLLLDQVLASADEFDIRKFLLHSTNAGRRLYEAAGFTTKTNWMELPYAMRAEN